MKLTDKHTLYASYLGYITQAIINNLPPLLFVTFQNHFDIPLSKISALITMNFVIQIIVDLISAKYVDRIGYRPSIVAAHVFAVLGLVSLGTLPFLIDPFTGIVIAMFLNAIGGGLTEVLISPIVESLPGDEKAAAMSVLHSFYCWGHMAVVILSTVYFVTVGTDHWQFLPFLWALLPLFNTFLYAFVPMHVLVAEEDKIPLSRLFSAKIFWLLFFLMLCAGASEQAMSQWSSYFAERGLGVSKTLGDLLGPCAFALMMGLSRLIYGKLGSRMNVQRFIVISAALCIFSYLLTVFAPHPILSLIGCGICGFSVGIFWPGVFTTAAATYPAGGTAMFALLALAGDVGCGGGPGLVGVISGAAKDGFEAVKAIIPAGAETELKVGMLIAVIFPVGMIAGMAALKKMSAKKQ
ncbi:MAG: MFS transporter [Ruminococcaceae bacterium]|nr:MFS transporter [Oscillospiraceae bacterium]